MSENCLRLITIMFEFASFYLSVAIATFVCFTVVGPCLALAGYKRARFEYTLLNLGCALLCAVAWPLALGVLYLITRDCAKKKEQEIIARLEAMARNQS